MSHLITTQGKLTEDQLGLILPHEHIYVDMQALERSPDFYVDPADVIALMGTGSRKSKKRRGDSPGGLHAGRGRAAL